MANMKKQVIDQAAHILLACVILTPVALWPNITTLGFTGLCLGLIREVSQHGKLLLSVGSLLDICCWAMGGMCVGLIVLAVN